MDTEQKTERLFMRADPAFIRRVDDWRRQQPDIPSRSEAIRRLVDLALSASTPRPLKSRE